MRVRRAANGIVAGLLIATLCGACVVPTQTPSVGEPTASPTPAPTPDLTAPRISFQDPAPGGVMSASGLTVRFSEPVRGVDIGAFQLSDAAGTVQGATVTLDPTMRITTLVPEVAPIFAATYTATLNGLVRDLAGNPLAPTSWTMTTNDQVTFGAGTYTGYQFGDTTADLLAMKRSTLDTPLRATASEYRLMDGVGYLMIEAGTWQGYWVHGSREGLAQDDLTAPIPPLPACKYRDILAVRSSVADWSTTVLDTVFQLPDGYAPGDLVDTTKAGLNGGHLIRSIAMGDLSALVAAAKASGATLAVESAYRSYAGQVATFNAWVRQVGQAEALQTSARPGHSEHQLGTAIDFRSIGALPPWQYADWATSREGAWLAVNAWRFGWVMSYPKGTTGVSCYRYEPWHYRFVGRETAAALHGAGVTLRQWLWARGYGVR